MDNIAIYNETKYKEISHYNCFKEPLRKILNELNKRTPEKREIIYNRLSKVTKSYILLNK